MTICEARWDYRRQAYMYPESDKPDISCPPNASAHISFVAERRNQKLIDPVFFPFRDKETSVWRYYYSLHPETKDTLVPCLFEAIIDTLLSHIDPDDTNQILYDSGGATRRLGYPHIEYGFTDETIRLIAHAAPKSFWDSSYPDPLNVGSQTTTIMRCSPNHDLKLKIPPGHGDLLQQTIFPELVQHLIDVVATESIPGLRVRPSVDLKNDECSIKLPLDKNEWSSYNRRLWSPPRYGCELSLKGKPDSFDTWFYMQPNNRDTYFCVNFKIIEIRPGHKVIHITSNSTLIEGFENLNIFISIAGNPGDERSVYAPSFQDAENNVQFHRRANSIAVTNIPKAESWEKQIFELPSPTTNISVLRKKRNLGRFFRYLSSQFEDSTVIPSCLENYMKMINSYCALFKDTQTDSQYISDMVITTMLIPNIMQHFCEETALGVRHPELKKLLSNLIPDFSPYPRLLLPVVEKDEMGRYKLHIGGGSYQDILSVNRLSSALL
jgi:hypothetical protein